MRNCNIVFIPLLFILLFSCDKNGNDDSEKENVIETVQVTFFNTSSYKAIVHRDSFYGPIVTEVDTISRTSTISIAANNNDITVFSIYFIIYPMQHPEVETLTLPAHQIIIEAVQNFGATSVSIAAYTASGNNVVAAGGTARSNAAIVIRVNYSFNGSGMVVPSQAAVTLAIRNLFTGFTNVTASVSPTALFPLPSHASIISIAGSQGTNNLTILGYTANNETIGEYFYGSMPSNTQIRISITYDVGANVTLVEQAVRGLFQHFSSVTIITMFSPPTPEEIINALNNAGAEYVNIVSYTIAGANASAGLRAINVAIQIVVYYTTLSDSSNGQTAVRNLFTGFTNANIFVGNNIPILLPSESQIINAVEGNSECIANIRTYTVNGISASTLSSALSRDEIIVRIRAETWVSTGFGWGQGYSIIHWYRL
jgi:hypothetical protein